MNMSAEKFLNFHTWQDGVFTVASMALIATTLPIIFEKNKPSLLASIPSCAVLLSVAYSFYTLDYGPSSLSNGTEGLAWGVIAAQRVMEDRAHKKNGTKR
jgi:hypothetical protein